MSANLASMGLKPLHPEMLAHWSDGQGCWCTHDHWIYRYDYATEGLAKVFRLPAMSNALLTRFKDMLARSWPRRKWRPGPGIYLLVQLANKDVLVVHDRVYWYSPSQNGIFAEPLASEAVPPLAAPLRGGMAVHAQSQQVYYGEYLNGHQRDIRVVRVDVASRRVDVCWTFQRSEIKHIHAIQYDRFRNRLWICTGDLDHESNIYYTDDEFATVHHFAGGDQSWRAIALLFDETGIEWGMDAGKDAAADALNCIYRYDFSTGQRSELAVIGNPAYAACEFTDGTAMIQTTFEPGRPQDTPEEAALWFRGHDRQWRQCLGLPYAPKPRQGVSRYGSIMVPQGISPAGELLCTPVNCHTGHYTLMKFRWPALPELPA